MLTRDGILITEVDANLSYVGTEDGRGYGPRDIDETLSRATAKARKRLAAAAERKVPTPPQAPEPTSAGYWLDVAEAARSAHQAVASASVPISSGKSYDRSREAFIAAIHVAYPELDKFGVYGVWVDSMEPVRYCARIFSEMDRDDQRKFIAIGGGLS